MLTPYRSVSATRRDVPEVPEPLTDIWQSCLVEAERTIDAIGGWNGPVPAVVSVTDAQGVVRIDWCEVRYAHQLAARHLAGRVGKGAPAWMLCASLDVTVPLWCADGQVRALRSNSVGVLPGMWHHAGAEGIDLGDLDDGGELDVVGIGRRALAEELGLSDDSVTVSGGWYSRGFQPGWTLSFYTPAVTSRSFDDIVQLWEHAHDRWEAGALELTAPGPWGNQVPGLLHPERPVF